MSFIRNKPKSSIFVVMTFRKNSGQISEFLQNPCFFLVMSTFEIKDSGDIEGKSEPIHKIGSINGKDD